MRKRTNLVPVLGTLGVALVTLSTCKKREGRQRPGKAAGRKAEPAQPRGGGGSGIRSAAKTSVPSEPARLPDGLARLQQGPVKVALGLRVDALRKSPYWSLISGTRDFQKLVQAEEYELLKKVCRFDPLTDVREARILFGGDFLERKGAKPVVAAVLRGGFDAKRVLECSKTLAATGGDRGLPKEESIGGRPALVMADEDGPRAVLYAAGDRELVIFEERARSLVLGKGSPLLRAIEGVVPKDAVAWVVFGSVPVRPGDVPPPLEGVKKIRKIVGGYVYVVGRGSRYVMHVAADVGSPEAAETVVQIAAMVKPMALLAAASEPELRPHERFIKTLVDSVRVKSDKSCVYLGVPLPGADFLRKLVEKM